MVVIPSRPVDTAPRLRTVVCHRMARPAAAMGRPRLRTGGVRTATLAHMDRVSAVMAHLPLLRRTMDVGAMEVRPRRLLAAHHQGTPLRPVAIPRLVATPPRRVMPQAATPHTVVMPLRRRTRQAVTHRLVVIPPRRAARRVVTPPMPVATLLLPTLTSS